MSRVLLALLPAATVTVGFATPVFAQDLLGTSPDPAGSASIWSRIAGTLAQSYAQEPQLVLVAALLVGLLPIASIAVLASRFGLGALIGRGLGGLSRSAAASAAAQKQIAGARGQLPMLDILDVEADSRPISGDMVRIGRHEENDIRLASQTVHRYHAVLHRTPEQGFIITDLSGPEGNGVVVNAQRVDQAALAAGDLIELGNVRLRFRFGELH